MLYLFITLDYVTGRSVPVISKNTKQGKRLDHVISDDDSVVREHHVIHRSADVNHHHIHHRIPDHPEQEPWLEDFTKVSTYQHSQWPPSQSLQSFIHSFIY